MALLALPPYLVGEVLSRLDATDLARCELVCRELKLPCSQVMHGSRAPRGAFSRPVETLSGESVRRRLTAHVFAHNAIFYYRVAKRSPPERA